MFQKLNNHAKNGLEISPLSVEDGSAKEYFGLEKFNNRTWLLKARLSIHILASLVGKFE